MTRTELAAVMRLDLGEVRRSRWLAACWLVYGALGALFVLVGLRESSVYGFTGIGRVLFSLCHALVLVLPLLALLATVQAVNRAREDGSLELFLSHPISRGSFLTGVTAVRFAVLALPLCAVVGLLAAGMAALLGEPVPWSFLARALAVCVALIAAYAGIGIATSVQVRHPARATSLVFAIWAASVALLDFAAIGLLLQWQVPPRAVFVLAAANPVQAARMALLSSAEPSLATLGPVGFYLATRVGSGALLALGLVWPVVVGSLAWLVAARSFRRGDAV